MIGIVCRLSLLSTCAAACLLACGAAQAESRVELSVPGYTGTETLKDFPLPVRLSEKTVSGFAARGAKDIAFFDERGKPLDIDVETWNPAGESLVWVRVPELKKGTRLYVDGEGGRLKVEGGTKEFSTSSVQPSTSNLQPPSTSVWRDYVGVWHFAEEKGTAFDALGKYNAIPTGWAGTNRMVSTEGPTGRARVLSDRFREPSCFTVEKSESITFGGRLTFSGWYKSDKPNPYKIVRFVTKTTDKHWWSSPGGWGIGLNGLTCLSVDGSKDTKFAMIPNTFDGAWHHLSVSWDGENATASIDGVAYEVKGRFLPAGDAEKNPITFGIPRARSYNPIPLCGAVDEFRIRKEPVSAAWAKAEYESLANPLYVVAKGVNVPRWKTPAERAPRADRTGTLPVIPRVSSWKPTDGTVHVGRAVKGVGAEAEEVAKILAADLKEGGRLKVEGGTKEFSTSSVQPSTSNLQPEPQSICLTVDAAISANPEGYRLTVAPTGVTIVGASRTGLYWGTRTLLQLLDAAPDGCTIACGVVDDAPASRRRGFMLDVARKYFPLAYVKDLAKVMAYYKMNDFHLHLNDNGGKEIADDWKDIYAAFRMECETYPGLTAKDGFYKKAEFRQFIKDAAKIGVQVVPEFDAPAHSLAFTRYRPDFAKKDYDPAHLELKNPEVIPFFEKLWAEYLGGDDPVFAGPVVHVGSDEYWAKESELFRVFLDRMLGVVQSYGKTPRAWGSLEHCRGKTPVRAKGVELDIWYNPYYSAIQATDAGYKVISIGDNDFYICPACGYYHDYLELKNIYRKWLPHYVGGDELDPNDPLLLGGAFAVWNDHIGNGISSDDVTDRVFPALQVMAEKLWHGKDRDDDYEKFAALADTLAEAPGVNLRDRVTTNALGIVDLASAKAVGWSQQGGWTVSFELTVDGKEPKDTILFDDGMSQVCLNLGGKGRFGFRRDGYDCPFRDPLPTGKLAVTMTGDAKGTSLYLGGKLVERLEKPRRVITKKGYKMAQVETLHFPLVKAKGADGRVGKLDVRLGCNKEKKQ